MSNLKNLIEAVEAGKIWLKDSQQWRSVGINGFVATEAFYGSLDAAKRLHDALLPGWVARPQIGGSGAGVTAWHCTLEDWDSGAEIDVNNMSDPARAWLLAILKALRAKEAGE